VRLEQTCAVKVLPQTLSALPGFEARFLSEGRALARLEHPNVVRVLNAGESSGRHYIAMEYVAGGNLASVLASTGGRLHEAAARRILSQLLSGLAAAHAAGIVHRDLKPANILIGRDGGARIGDFGLAVAAPAGAAAATQGDRDPDATLPADGTIDGAETLPAEGPAPSAGTGAVGTLDYMGPEVRAGRSADTRSDVFAVGVLAYQILTGRKPIGSPRPPSKIVRGISPKWDAWVSRCMEFEPKDRFQDAAKALAALPPPKRSARRAVLAALVAILAAAAFLGVRHYREEASSPAHLIAVAEAGYAGLDFSAALEASSTAAASARATPGEKCRALLCNAMASEALDRPDDALVAYRSARKVDGADAASLSKALEGEASLLFRRASGLERAGDAAGAVKAYAATAALPVNSFTPRSLAAAGFLCGQNGDEAAELDYFARFLALAERPAGLTNSVLSARAALMEGRGDWDAAAADFRRLLAEGSPDAAQKASVENEVVRLTSPGSLFVESDPPGALASVDGVPSTATPASFDSLPAGRHTLVISMDGYDPVSSEITLEPSAKLELPLFSLVRQTGGLEMTSQTPGVGWRIVGAPDDAGFEAEAGTLPARLDDLPTGEYSVEFSRPGWRRVTRSVRISKDALASLDAGFVPGRLRVDSVPRGASVTDASGRVLGKTPLDLPDFPTGSVSLTLSLPGRVPAKLSGEVRAGESLLLQSALAEHPSVAALARARLLDDACDDAGALAEYCAIVRMDDVPPEILSRALSGRSAQKLACGDAKGASEDARAAASVEGARASAKTLALCSAARAAAVLGDESGARALFGAAEALATGALAQAGADVPELLLLRGEARAELGNHQAGMADFTTLLGRTDGVTPSLTARALLARAELTRRFSIGGERGDLTSLIAMDAAPARLRLKGLLLRAATRRNLGDADGAISDLSAVIAADNAPAYLRAEAFTSRSVLRTINSDTAGALSDLTWAVSMPGVPSGLRVEALLLRADIRLRSGDWKGAAGDCDAALAEPAASLNAARGHRTRSLARRQLGDVSGAIADCAAVLELDGVSDDDKAEALLLRADIHLSIGVYRPAMNDCETVLALPGVGAEQFARATLCRGRCRLLSGDREGAATDFRAAMAVEGAPRSVIDEAAAALGSPGPQ